MDMPRENRYILTAHAKERMRERAIPAQLIRDALRNPTNVSYNVHRQLLIKKLYKRKGNERLLLMVVERAGDQLKIITVIDTSKIKKYL